MHAVRRARMKVTIATVPEHPAEVWWSAARQAKDIPRELRPLVGGKSSTIEVSRDRARDLRAWCARLPGWDAERAALSFVGLVGRPPSPRRSAGGIRVTVRLSADERTALDALATARGQSLADVLRTSALIEAKREAARTEERADGTAPAEPIAVADLAIGDLVYPNAAHLPPRGRPERVLTLRQEHELWCIELANGPPLWIAAGAHVWRRQRRARS
jgi:hypothetical protein